ncbi:MAG: Co2+/Mg2+ efflux protein ApaG [Bacteroidota bacterium]
MLSYSAITEGIEITVRPVYLDEKSDYFEKRFVFGYLVRILNASYSEVQLLRRHWTIQEGNGRVQEVEGEGVIGQQPILQPGETYEYSSYCVLGSFEGAMHGTYLLERGNGSRFKAAIPRFDLVANAN